MLKSLSGKDEAAPKRGSKLAFPPGKSISVSYQSDTTKVSEGESDTEES